MPIIISIPYGAIKVGQPYSYMVNYISISIPMVRLKDSFTLIKIMHVISIPYGAIKRQMRMSKGYENLISIPYGAIKRQNENE